MLVTRSSLWKAQSTIGKSIYSGTSSSSRAELLLFRTFAAVRNKPNPTPTTFISRNCHNNIALFTGTTSRLAQKQQQNRLYSQIVKSALVTSTGGNIFDNYNSSSNSSLRHFSSSPPSSGEEEKKQDEEIVDTSNMSFIDRTKHMIVKTVVTPRNQFYALVVGGSIGAYGLSRIVLSFTSFFTHLTPQVIAKWSFYTGFTTATLLGGAVLLTIENLYIRADPVYQYCYKWIRNDKQIQQVLGDGITSGSLRSYRLDSGKFLSPVGGSSYLSTPEWNPPRIQMIFDVAGQGPPYRTGLVTCEAIKHYGFPPRLQTTLLKVDYETGNEGEGGDIEDDQTIYLVGNQDDVKRISKRSGLSLDCLAQAVHINKAAAGK